MSCVGLSPGAENTAEFSTFFLPNFLTLDLFSHCHLSPLLFPPSLSFHAFLRPESFSWRPCPFPLERKGLFSLSLSLKMTILEYLVALVVPWGKILPFGSQNPIALRIPEAGTAFPSLGIQKEKRWGSPEWNCSISLNTLPAICLFEDVNYYYYSYKLLI